MLLTSQDIGEEKFNQFVDNFDIGDFIEVGGNLFLTKTQEKTLKASSVTMLAKSLRPLPGEYYSLADEEIRGCASATLKFTLSQTQQASSLRRQNFGMRTPGSWPTVAF